MWYWKESFLLKNKPRYHQAFFCLSITPPKGLKSKEGGLKFRWSREMKNFWLVILNDKAELFEIIL